MKHKLTILAASVFLLLQPMLCPAPAFMKLGDIKGEATDADHKDWVIIQSMSLPIHKPGGSASAVFEDIVVVKQLDKSSPKLAEAVANGTHIPDATIVLTRLVGETQRPYIEVKMKDVLISSYQLNPDPPTGLASRERQDDFSFTLNFEKITLRYGGIRQTVIRYDENGNEIERVTVGLPTRLGGVVPPEDDVPPGGSNVDSMTISASEAEAVKQAGESDVAG